LDITFSGHSCFHLRGRTTDLITDPFPLNTDSSINEASANVITVSHAHQGHCYTEGVAGEGRVVAGPGEYEVRGAIIRGISSFHDSERGKSRGRNTVFTLEIDGLRLAHLGDIGHMPSAKLMEALKGLDVLFVPVGGHSTITPEEAAQVVRQLRPRVAIPMHYASGTSPSPLCGVESFLEASGAGAAPGEGDNSTAARPRLSVSPSTLPPAPQIVVLSRSR
jgi:L-ascorbate metabolism protein UlaG (beta-lactamase superfamily)